MAAFIFNLIYKLLTSLQRVRRLWLIAGRRLKKRKGSRTRDGDTVCTRLPPAPQQASCGLCSVWMHGYIRHSLQARLTLPRPLIDWSDIELKENLTLYMWRCLGLIISPVCLGVLRGQLSSTWKDSCYIYSHYLYSALWNTLSGYIYCTSSRVRRMTTPVPNCRTQMIHLPI